ncbi:isopentenyl-diphosphate Delta-isomerase [Patescibacteria group bacterium]|nr:isopentenyl-diphosphate Delta-isomerase [Patescibacteria group bacterium]MBU0964171.1 isopentenyl-diphosphate Delta-isomerase [Patescibacteria group bacterium]
MSENVILVDTNDKEVGIMEKMEAHKKGLLHRCFSIFVFNSKKELLIQKRAAGKYHCGGLWTNTVCSHPRSGEDINQAVHRRLQEEMGFDCELKEVTSFIYKSKFDNGLTENEYDHVFVGEYDQEPVINKEEADEFKWIGIDELKKDINSSPDNYTPWFKIIISQHWRKISAILNSIS